MFTDFVAIAFVSAVASCIISHSIFKTKLAAILGFILGPVGIVICLIIRCVKEARQRKSEKAGVHAFGPVEDNPTQGHLGIGRHSLVLALRTARPKVPLCSP